MLLETDNIMINKQIEEDGKIHNKENNVKYNFLRAENAEFIFSKYKILEEEMMFTFLKL